MPTYLLASSECQKLNMDNGSRSFDTTLAEPGSWTPLSKIKLLFNDPADLAREAEEIKKPLLENLRRMTTGRSPPPPSCSGLTRASVEAPGHRKWPRTISGGP